MTRQDKTPTLLDRFSNTKKAIAIAFALLALGAASTRIFASAADLNTTKADIKVLQADDVATKTSIQYMDKDLDAIENHFGIPIPHPTPSPTVSP